MRNNSRGRGVVISCLILWSCLSTQAQTLDMSFGTGGVLTIDQFGDDYNRNLFVQGNRLIVAGSDNSENGFNVTGFTLNGQFDPSFDQIGDGMISSVPMEGFDMFAESSTGRIVHHTDTRSYFVLTGVGDELSEFNQKLRTSITAYDQDGNLVDDFGTNGKMTLEITTPGDFWSFMGGDNFLTDNGFITVAPFYDTLAIAKINLDGTPNSSYGVNGVYKFETSNLFGTNEYYSYSGSVVIGEDISILFSKYNSADGTYSLRILRLAADNSTTIYNLDWALGDYNGMPILPRLHCLDDIPYVGWKPLDSNQNVLSRCTNDWTEEARFDELDGLAKFTRDLQGRYYFFMTTGFQEPFIATCLRFTATTSDDGGQLDTSFGVNGYLTYPTTLDVDGTEFVNLDFTNDAMYAAVQVGDIYTPDGDQDVLILKYNMSTTNSVEETQTEGFSVYPNPANDQLSLFNAGEGTIEIFTNDGRLVHSQQIKANTTVNQIEVSNLPSGIYFIKHRNKTNIRTSKFIKQ